MTATPSTPLAVATRRIVLGLVALLCAVFAAWHLDRYTPRTAMLVLVLALTPWLAPLRGLRGGDRRTYALSTLLTLPYLGYGLMETLANPGARAYAGTTVFVSFGLFVALIAYLRVSRPPAPAPT